MQLLISEHEVNVGCGPLRPAPHEDQVPLRQQVLERVRAAGLTSRVQVAKALSVSAASVTPVVTELIEAGLLEEAAAPREGLEAARGRPPVGLRLRGAAHAVAGLKIADREMSAVILDFAGARLAEATRPRAAGADPLAKLVADAGSLLDTALAAARMARHDLSGVGLGLPGFVAAQEGRVIWSPVLHERRADLAGALTRALDLPVAIDNDANLVAMAELWFGKGRGLSDFAVVTIEHGVGMGLVIGHRPYRGARGLGLEIAHTKVHLDGALCRCGQRGCLEAYVADYALAREASAALGRTGLATPTLPEVIESLYDHAKAGNPAARSIFRRAGRYLAVGIANLINLFDPALILLSGERMRYDYLYADDTLAELTQLSLEGAPLPPIEIHAWRDLLWARGAAALALARLTDAEVGARTGAWG